MIKKAHPPSLLNFLLEKMMGLHAWVYIPCMTLWLTANGRAPLRLLLYKFVLYLKQFKTNCFIFKRNWSFWHTELVMCEDTWKTILPILDWQSQSLRFLIYFVDRPKFCFSEDWRRFPFEFVFQNIENPIFWKLIKFFTQNRSCLQKVVTKFCIYKQSKNFIYCLQYTVVVSSKLVFEMSDSREVFLFHF